MDYLEYFGLSAEPFSHAPVSRFYYASRQHTEALKRLIYAAQNMKGLAILIGDVGHGKTTLARRLLDSLPQAEFEAAMLVVVHAGVTANWLLKRIASQLGVPEPADDKLTILSQLYARLVEVHKGGKKAVVLIDEAQMLGTRELMEEFRGLLNLEVPGHKLINFVFFGLPETERNLQLDPPLAQRVALRFHLKPLGVDETTAYVQHRLKLAGSKDELFPPAALAEVHRLTRGIPRVINTLCDNVLLELFFGKLAVASPELVSSVADNLGMMVTVSSPPLGPVPVAPDQPATPGSAGEDAVLAVPREGTGAADHAPLEAALDPHAIAARVASEGAPPDRQFAAATARGGGAGASDVDAPLSFAGGGWGAGPAWVAPPTAAEASFERALEPPSGAPAAAALGLPYSADVDVSTIKPRLVVPAPSGAGPAPAPGSAPEPVLPEHEPEPEIVARYDAAGLPVSAAGQPQPVVASLAEPAPARPAPAKASPPAAEAAGASNLAAALAETVATAVVGSPAAAPAPSASGHAPAAPRPATPATPARPASEPKPAAPKTAIKTSKGTIDLAEIDDLLADIERR